MVHGIAGAGDLKKVGRVGVKAIVYFECITTIALALGIVLAYVFQPGVGMNIDPNSLDPKAMSGYVDRSTQVASASSQVSASSQTLAQGASEQAAALEETTSALEEMSSMTKKNADTAQQASALAAEAKAAAAELKKLAAKK